LFVTVEQAHVPGEICANLFRGFAAQASKEQREVEVLMASERQALEPSPKLDLDLLLAGC
jgi:hypothetical protein